MHSAHDAGDLMARERQLHCKMTADGARAENAYPHRNVLFRSYAAFLQNPDAFGERSLYIEACFGEIAVTVVCPNRSVREPQLVQQDHRRTRPPRPPLWRI